MTAGRIGTLPLEVAGAIVQRVPPTVVNATPPRGLNAT